MQPRQKTIYLPLLLSALLFSPPAFSTEILSWQACVEEARRNHPDLTAAQKGIDAAKAEKNATRSSLLPQVNLEAGARRGENGNTATDSISYGATVRQTLFDGFQSIDQTRAAAKRVESSEFGLQKTSSEVRKGLRLAFANLMKAQQLVELTEQIVARRQQSLDLVQLRYEAGREHKGSLLTSQANLRQAEFEVKEAQRNLTLSQTTLAKSLGRKRTQPIAVTGTWTASETTTEPPNFDELIARTPSIQQQRTLQEAYKKEWSATKGERWPTLTADGAVDRNSTEWPPDQTGWSVGATLSFPLFEGGRRNAEVQKAHAAYRQQEAITRSLENSEREKLESIYKFFLDASESVEVRQKYLQASRERAKITAAQYSIGLTSFDNWIIIEDALVDNQKAHLQALANLLIAEAGWVNVRGGTLNEG